LQRITMPGVQKPHCSAPVEAKAATMRSRSASSSPSSVVTDRPSTLASDRLQLTVALPSSSTVQHPHWPEGAQPSLGEVTSSSSRRAASRWGWSPTVTSEPLSEKLTIGRQPGTFQQDVEVFVVTSL
jgi:hypothetical protein